MQTVNISSGTIIRILVILLMVWFLYFIRDILLILFSAIIIASAVEPVANWLQRYKVPRAISVAGTYLVVLGVLSLTVTLMVPPLTEQVVQLAQALPQVVEELERGVGLVLPSDENVIVAPLQDMLLRFSESLANTGFRIFEGTRSVFSGILSLMFVFIIAFYIVVEEDALKKLFRYVIPKQHLTYANSLIERAQRMIGRWILAQLSLAVLIGLIVSVGLWLLGVKYALVLGLLAGVLEIIPVIGPIIAAIPGVLVGLSDSLWLGVAALVFYVLVQQAENHVLVPNIMRKATGLNPLITLVAVLLGGRIAGVVGVILAIPVATIVSIFLSDFFTKAPVDDELAG